MIFNQKNHWSRSLISQKSRRFQTIVTFLDTSGHVSIESLYWLIYDKNASGIYKSQRFYAESSGLDSNACTASIPLIDRALFLDLPVPSRFLKGLNFSQLILRTGIPTQSSTSRFNHHREVFTILSTLLMKNYDSRRKSPMKIGLVDVGGGYRGIYETGVLDYCLDFRISFDLGIGVSAGSANLISYAAGQYKRNYQFFTEYGLRKEYAGMKNFICRKSYLDLDYVYSTLSNSDGENPLNYSEFQRNPMEFLVVATEAETGKAVYFNKNDVKQDDYSILKASCAIPFVCHPYRVGETPYYDGALSDPVPIQKAFDLGCDKVIVLLTKPENQVRTPGNDTKLARMIQRQYPIAAEKLRQRAALYNAGVALTQKYVKEGRALIVAPDDTCGVGTLTRDARKLDLLYQKGYYDGKKIAKFLK